MMLRKLLITAVVLLAVSSIGSVVAVNQLRERVETPYQAYPDDGVLVDIEPGDSSPSHCREVGSGRCSA